MPSDFITLNALARELNDTLKNGKIDKIYMPEKDEITLQIRANGKSHLLAISCNASNPRLHLTASKKENPQTAPSFCMHLRKHLTGGIILSIDMLGQDRIVCMKIACHNEMRDEVTYSLIAEMMGRYSNILLVNNKNIITDTLKQASFDAVTKRCLLPSAKYELPEQSKILPNNIDEILKVLLTFNQDENNENCDCISNNKSPIVEEKFQIMQIANIDEFALKLDKNATNCDDFNKKSKKMPVFANCNINNLSKFLTTNIAGLSPQSASEIVASAGLNDGQKTVTKENAMAILKELNKLLNIYDSADFSPCVAVVNGKTQDFFACKYSTINGLVKSPSLNEAICECVSKKDENFRQEEHTRHLQKALNSIISRNEKKLAKANEKLFQTQSSDNLKLCGDIITSNMYLLKKGQSEAQLPNYYEEDSPIITIKLNEQFTPAQNAQDYFKKYAKQKRTKDIVSVQIVEISDLIEYLYSIQNSLSLCKTQIEITELSDELQKIGAIKKPKNQKNKIKPAQPITYDVFDFVICVGKNNIQNDKLTFKLANGNDLWLHTKAHHGSHTVIFAEARQIPDNVIQIGAEIAAFYSQGNTAPKVEVDYTCRKNLHRHPSGQLGMVTYSDFKNAFVAPNAHLEFLDKNA